MGNGIDVRQAEFRHMAGVHDLLVTLHSEHGFSPYPPPDDVALSHGLLEAFEKGFVLVALDDDRVVGTMVLERAFYFWNNKQVFLRNIFFSVLPEFRSMKIVEAFLKLSKRFADEEGLQLVIGIMSDEGADLKDRVLKTKGARYVGGNFVIE